MRVAANQGQSRQSDSLLGPHNVDDALAFVAPTKDVHAEIVCVLIHGCQDFTSPGIFDLGDGRRVSRRIVIWRQKSLSGTGDTPLHGSQTAPAEGSVVTKISIDVKQTLAIVTLYHHVPLPDLLEQCFARHIQPFSTQRPVVDPISQFPGEPPAT